MAKFKQLVVLKYIFVVIMVVEGQANPQCFDKGECVDSLMLDFLHDVDDAQTCLEMCQQDDDCNYFTFYEDDNSCLTLVNCVTFSTDSCHHCYSGARACEDLQCWVSGRCKGTLIDETYDVRGNECLVHCQANDDCNWFTHDSDGWICLMFDDCEELDTSCPTCVSSQPQCPQLEVNTDLTKIMVIGGTNEILGGGDLSSIEIISLDGQTSTCAPISDYPVGDYGMTAAIVDGLIKSCGSMKDNENCYDYDPIRNIWTQSTDMLKKRFLPSSSFIDGVWLVSGDDDEAGDFPLTSEIWTGSEFIEGPELPDHMFARCQVTINSTHIFFASHGDQPFLYDWFEDKWTILPPFNQNNYWPACGLINNPENGLEIVIDSGSFSYILNLSTMEWRDGPYKPLGDFDRAGLAQLTDTFVEVGGGNGVYYAMNTIVLFDHINYEWIVLDQLLEVPRGNFPAVVAIPDGFISCY